MKKRYLILLLTGWIGAASCSSSPTGRARMALFPDSKMNEMGIQAFEELKQKVPKESSPAINSYVRCVTDSLLSVTQDKTGVKSWEVVVFKDAAANAFALPGGKIGVYTGILPVAKTPGQLAAVLGHEVGHVIARHGNERVTQTTGANLGLSAVDLLAKNSTHREGILSAIGLGAQYGVILPFSRTHESEADEIGQEMMARAGFDPRESVALWKNMEKLSGNAPPEFASTHPSHSRRIRDLQNHLSTSYPLYLLAKKSGKNPHCRVP